MTHTIETLQAALRDFAKAREWEQFHSPKNLAAALSVEAAELLEPFQWLTEEQSANLSEEQLASVRDELADVLNYLVQLADKLDIDLIDAAYQKIRRNAEKYPTSGPGGSALKRSDS